MAARILIIRGQRVLLDADLAVVYGVSTKRLNEQVRRNRARFPQDFVFQIEKTEILASNRSLIATGSQRHRDPRFPPYAFTEHGAIMAATVLNSPEAVQMSVYVVRAFVRFRELLASNTNLARKLANLERAVARLDSDTQIQFKEVYVAIKALMALPPTKRRPIGFTADLDE